MLNKKLMKRYLKNQRGLTLIELLATIVILGIISAIAVPAIGGLIENSKKDAEVANATQIINSAKLYVTGHSEHFDAVTSTAPQYIPLNALYSDKQLEKVKDPLNNNTDYAYDANATTDTPNPPTSGSYVQVSRDGGDLVYKIKLVPSGKTGNYFSNSTTTQGSTTPTITTTDPVDSSRLKRDFVAQPAS